MKQGIQSNFPQETLKEYGCYFFCMLKWAEFLRNREYTEEQIMAIFVCARMFKFVDDEATVLQPSSFMNWLLDRSLYITSSKPREKPQLDTYVMCLQKPGFTHFVLSHRGETWDPLDPRRPGAKGYTVDSYRVIT